MIYCDVEIDSTVIWTGVPCLHGVCLKASNYIALRGNLVFYDVRGTLDPEYLGLGVRYFLFYYPDDGTNVQNIPVSAEPAQQFNVVLNDQNCSITLYQKPTEA